MRNSPLAPPQASMNAAEALRAIAARYRPLFAAFHAGSCVLEMLDAKQSHPQG